MNVFNDFMLFLVICFIVFIFILFIQSSIDSDNKLNEDFISIIENKHTVREIYCLKYVKKIEDKLKYCVVK